MGNETEVQGYDSYYDSATWELTFAWLPHRCEKTGKEIWFEWAYCGSRQYRVSDNNFIFDRRWITRDSWMIEKLKGTI